MSLKRTFLTLDQFRCIFLALNFFYAIRSLSPKPGDITSMHECAHYHRSCGDVPWPASGVGEGEGPGCSCRGTTGSWGACCTAAAAAAAAIVTAERVEPCLRYTYTYTL